ncbi:MAG: NADH-quinone oxidoreductase subunit NuoK [Chloroflexi bacterium]|nr:NADH-quinone oxidoreductase subunit NuoK [Chloroflexota bacterium]
MTIGLEEYLVIGAVLFGIGLYVALSKRNAVGVLMGIELMLNAVNLTLVAFSRFSDSDVALSTQVFVVFIVATAAAEVAVGLALALVVYRNRRTVSVDEIDLLKW